MEGKVETQNVNIPSNVKVSESQSQDLRAGVRTQDTVERERVPWACTVLHVGESFELIFFTNG